MQFLKLASLEAKSPFLLLIVLAAIFSQLLNAQEAQSPSQPAGANTVGKAAESGGKSESTVAVAPDVPKPGPPTDDTSSIKVSVNEVIVPVTVTDDKGKFVSDLDEKDFQIFEENKPQKMTFFTRERSQPVVIGFLLDMSTASRIHWENFQNATVELIQTLLTGDPKYSGYDRFRARCGGGRRYDERSGADGR
jgi:hypothetical protein